MKSTETSFLKVSVVIIASATPEKPKLSRLSAIGFIFETILSKGRGTPITPVDATRTSVFFMPITSETSEII